MKRLFAVFILASFFSATYAQRILNLDSCRNLAIQNNKELLISKEKITKAYYDKKTAFTQFLPNFSATGGYMHFSDEISLLNGSQKNALNNLGSSFQQGVTTGLTPIIQHIAQTDPALAAKLQGLLQSGGLDGISNALNQVGQNITDAFRTDTRNVWAGAVSVTQPLYMGGKIRAYNNITKLSEQLAETQYSTQLQQTILSTDEAYWMVVSLSYKKKLAENFLELVEKLDNDVQKMIDEGVATQADGLTVRVKVNEAEMTLTKVDNGLALSRMLLCQLCGIDLNSEITLEDELKENIAFSQINTDNHVETALNNRPELKSLEYANSIYANKIKIVRSEMLPSLALTGGYMVSNPSLLNGFENKFKGMWNVGVILQVPIFHWNEGIYKVKSARAEANIARLQESDVKEKIELQVNQSVFKTSEAQKRMTLALKNMDKAQENLRFANRGFKEGVIPVTQVMEAQTAWMAAQSDKIDAQIDMKLADTYLQKAMGTLKQ